MEEMRLIEFQALTFCTISADARGLHLMLRLFTYIDAVAIPLSSLRRESFFQQTTKDFINAALSYTSNRECCIFLVLTKIFEHFFTQGRLLVERAVERPTVRVQVSSSIEQHLLSPIYLPTLERTRNA